MGSLDFRRQVASDMFDGLVDSEMADRGVYTAPGQTPPAEPNCRVVINRATGTEGTFARRLSNKSTIRILLEEIPSPAAGGTIAADGETFELVAELQSDGAMSIWEVKSI